MQQNIYDNEKFFNDYVSMRDTHLNANDLIEIPIFKFMLPDIKGKTILDLGCGYGEMCQYYIQQGAKSVLGLDISENMIDLAKEKKSDKIDFKVLKMEDLNKLTEKFDVVLSSLAFHYIKDFDKLCKDINNLLNKNGVLLFSNEHPVATCIIPANIKDFSKHIEIEGKRYYLISDYNNNGERLLNWNVDGVVKYHRNFSSLVNTLIQNGFIIDRIEEPSASQKAIELVDKYRYQVDRPYFIFIRAIKKL